MNITKANLLFLCALCFACGGFISSIFDPRYASLVKRNQTINVAENGLAVNGTGNIVSLSDMSPNPITEDSDAIVTDQSLVFRGDYLQGMCKVCRVYVYEKSDSLAPLYVEPERKGEKFRLVQPNPAYSHLNGTWHFYVTSGTYRVKVVHSVMEKWNDPAAEK